MNTVRLQTLRASLIDFSTSLDAFGAQGEACGEQARCSLQQRPFNQTSIDFEDRYG